MGSTFGGTAADGNRCSNGGAISSIGVSWTILNSVFSYNRAAGRGGNPATSGPGGGSGGAIYSDGNRMTLSLCGTRIEDNEVVQHGSGIFVVTNDHPGDVRLDRSALRRRSRWWGSARTGSRAVFAGGPRPTTREATASRRP